MTTNKRSMTPVLFLYSMALSLFLAGFGNSSDASANSAARFKIDASKSRFMVKAAAGGVLSFAGHDHNIAIRNFSGEVEFTYGTVEPASMEMNIKADSLAITDKDSESDKQKIETTMRDEVLEVSKYPDITFKTTSVNATKQDEGKFQARLNGNLTLHGVTKALTVPALLEFSENQVRAKGEFSIKQTSFGIKQVSAGGGTVKVKDELKFTFDIVAHP